MGVSFKGFPPRPLLPLRPSRLVLVLRNTSAGVPGRVQGPYGQWSLSSDPVASSNSPNAKWAHRARFRGEVRMSRVLPLCVNCISRTIATAASRAAAARVAPPVGAPASPGSP